MPNQSKFTTGQMAVGAGGILSIIATFLPWFGTSCSGSSACGLGYVSVSESGFNGWGILVFLLALIVVLLLAVRVFATTVNLPAFPIQDWMVFTIAGVAMIVFTLIDFAATPQASASGFGVSAGFGVSFGWFVALVAAVIVGVGGFLSKSDPQPATGSMSFGGPAASPPPPPPAPPAPPIQ